MIRGQVPQFQSIDLELLSFTLDGKTIETAPSKGAYDVIITCNNGAEGYWDYDEWGPQIKNITKKTKCSIAFTTGYGKDSFSNYLLEKNKEDNFLEKIEHEATTQTPALTDYRYVGKSPNNYVYFGCSDNCNEENLYRIIGVIPTQSNGNIKYENLVKLIKASNYEGNEGIISGATYTKSGKGYKWNTSANNSWEGSSLKEILNSEYYNSLGKYQNYIVPVVWYLGSLYWNNYVTYTYTPDQLYRDERSSTQNSSKGLLSIITNIGLIYPSDYGYSIGQSYRNISIKDKAGDYKTKAWLYNLEDKYREWTISPESGRTDGSYSWNIDLTGGITYLNISSIYGVRPTFFLKADVKYASGDGTIDSPYRIAL